MGPTIRESRLWMLESHCFKLNMKLWQLISWVIICGRLATQIVKYIYKLTMMISKPYLQIFEGKVHCSAGGLSDLIHHVYERAIYIYIYNMVWVPWGCMFVAWFNNCVGRGCQLWRDTWIYDWQTIPTVWRPKDAALWPPMQFMKDIPKPLETKGCPYIHIFLSLPLSSSLGLVFQLWRFELSWRLIVEGQEFSWNSQMKL